MFKSNIIPSVIKGKSIELNSTRTLTLHQAMHCFTKAKYHLQHPGTWQKICNTLSASFAVCDAQGTELDEELNYGSLLRIDIPGPGTIAGGGFDWVKVDALEQIADTQESLFAFRLRPAPAPDSSDHKVAHFFDEMATSTFILHRNRNQLTLYYYGRNEIPNLNTESSLDNLRNRVVSTGALAGLSELQWQALIDAILNVASKEEKF